MAVRGYLAVSGCPAIVVRIQGVATSVEVEALVDTGFNGFLRLPIVQAIPIGLLLDGTSFATYADGRSELNLTARVEILLGAESRKGTALLDFSGGEVLVGMAFLQEFRKSLVLHRSEVYLIDEPELDTALQFL
jgi:predicted aspartyl protease